MINRTAKTVLAACCLLALTVATGCEDLMTKQIDIDESDFPLSVAVSATLDTDSGRLTMVLYEARSLASWAPEREKDGIVRGGTASLYCNGEEVWRLAGDFDLSANKGGSSWDVFDYGNAVTENGGGGNVVGSKGEYRSINITGLPVEAGSEYRLVIDIKGYRTAVATAVMPAAAKVSDAEMDLEHPVTVNNVVNVQDRSFFSSSEKYWPINFTITDASAAQDYYVFKADVATDVPDSVHGVSPHYPYAVVGVDNSVLIQDNPDYEMYSGGVLDLLDGDTDCDLYVFNSMLLSDLAFANSTAQLKLFQSWIGYWDSRTAPMADYNPEVHGREVVAHCRMELGVQHITAETFRHYRSLVMQDGGMGFMDEPVPIASNVENGFGCFSLQNTLKVPFEFVLYFYPDYNPYYPPDDVIYE